MTIEVEIAGTGQIAEFPDGTPNDVIVNALSQLQTQKPSFPGAGFIEPALAIASGAIAEPAAGIAGLATSLIPGTAEGSGAGVVEGVREALTFQPRTEAGQAGLQAVGEAFQPVAEALQTAEQVAGDVGFELGGPVGGAVGAALPTAALEALGVAGLKGAAPAARAAAPITEVARGIFEFQSPTKQRLAELIERGSTDVETARFKLEAPAGERIQPETKLGKALNLGGPRVTKDRSATEAIKQGFDEGVIAAVKGSSKADKTAFKKMVNIMERGKKNARFAVLNRPSDVVGDLLMTRLRVVQRANNDAGKQLEGVAKSLKGKQVEFQPAIDTFIDDLGDMGILLDENFKPNFAGSDIEGLIGPEAAVNRIVKRLSTAKPPDAFELHRMKKFIDEQVTFGKNAEGLAGKTERVLKKLRRNLDQTLDSNFPRYDEVNTQYAETISALDEFQTVAGKKMDLTGKNADKATGTLMRRIMSNAQSRVNVLDSVNEIEQMAKKFGGKLTGQLKIKGPVRKGFENDLLSQVLFVDELDRVFGPVARTSFQGQIKQGVADVAGAAVSRTGAISAGVAAASKLAEKARGINQEGAFKTIKKLLGE